MAALRGQPGDVVAARASEKEQRREQPPEAAERVRGVWGMLGRLAAAPEPQQGRAGERTVTGDMAQAAREYGQLVVRAVAKVTEVLFMCVVFLNRDGRWGGLIGVWRGDIVASAWRV